MQLDLAQPNKLFWGGSPLISPQNQRKQLMDTRKYDLEELVQDRRKARSVYERDMVDRTIDRITRESGAVREKREKLIMAVRNDDKRAVQRFQRELNLLRLEETYGKAL